MCTKDCLDFGERCLEIQEVRNKKVLEVGSTNVNGSLRNFVVCLGPQQYLGVDISSGAGVDLICKAEDLVQTFGANFFDVVICTEVLEHVRDWRAVISNLKNVLSPNGILLITTRSKGFAYHSAPYDFWRYQIPDIKTIFSDLQINNLERDPSHPGVFLKARKPDNFNEAVLDEVKLYSIVKRKRLIAINDSKITWIDRKLNELDSRLRTRIFSFLPPSIKYFIKKKILRVI